MAAAAYPQDVQGEATSLILKYFLYNSRPVNLDGLMQLLTPDVIVDYPSGRFIGLESYMSHQAGTARVLRCCCSSSVVKPASSDSSEWGWNDAFMSCAPRALPQSINIDRIAVSCAVHWTYESRSPLLCCIPIRSSGCNRYCFEKLARHDGSTTLRICYVCAACIHDFARHTSLCPRYKFG